MISSPAGPLARAVATARPLQGAAPARGGGSGAAPDAATVLAAAVPGAAVLAAAGTALGDVLASSWTAEADSASRQALERLRSALGADAEPGPGAGTGPARSLPPARQALVGGFRAHLLDLDDTHEDVRGHPSAVLWPALLAAAEDADRLDALMAAYTVGLEVMARLGRALGSAHYRAGWHPTATTGPLGAAAALAHLRGLDEQTTARALSLAASRSGGLRAQFGTETKPLHAGLAAAAGVDAVAFARAGISAAEDAVAGPNGLLAAHGVEASVRERIAEGFGGAHGAGSGERSGGPGSGAPWALLSPGLWFKRHPHCSAAMSLADAAAEVGSQLVGAPAQRASQLREVRVKVRPGADAALIHTAPRTGEEGRFSAEHIAALRLLGIEPDLAALSPAPVDPLVAEVSARVRRAHVPAAAPATARRDFWARVEVDLADGRTLAAEVTEPVGSPRRPLPPQAHAGKLRAVAGPAADPILTVLGVPAAYRVSQLRAHLAVVEEQLRTPHDHQPDLPDRPTRP